MAAFRTGQVIDVTRSDGSLIECRVSLGEIDVSAVGFTAMMGPVAVGDRVVVNTTGVELELGTGGVGFMLWNLDGSGAVEPGPGHIVKMRYTPWQTEVVSAEAPESPHHEALVDVESIEGMPVIACGLHSHLGAAAAGIKAHSPDARVGYLMTDGAALPLRWSRQIGTLKDAGLVDVSCSAGHCFGGDLESVNVFSGLAALRSAAGCDAVVVAMGPGVVGTSTALGFTALEQGQVLDAATALGGAAVAVLRISFVDRRRRHLGVSHHTLTALRIAARERAAVVVPVLPEDRLERVTSQLEEAGIYERHDVVLVDGAPGLSLLADKGIRPSSMGRSLDETPELFVAATAAGVHAASLIV
jgi:hypothetical protein